MITQKRKCPDGDEGAWTLQLKRYVQVHVAREEDIRGAHVRLGLSAAMAGSFQLVMVH